jgi:hypothetical protein
VIVPDCSHRHPGIGGQLADREHGSRLPQPATPRTASAIARKSLRRIAL